MNRLPGLDLLRSIAIVWVMLFHSFIVGGLGPNFEWLSRFGWAGVDIFFVLSGFIITTILGIVGAFVATYLGQAVGWYRADEGAGFIGAVVGAIIVLAVYHFIQRRSTAGGRN